MFLWCPLPDSSCLPWVENGLAKNGIEQYLRFKSPVAFTRWLFSQRRGAVRPWSVLLVDWRHAKPCSSAVATARSGCLQHLEHLPVDAQRPNLPALTLSNEAEDASSLQPVNAAVCAMIIIVSHGTQACRADHWVRKMQAAEHWWANGFKFFIANDPQSLTVSLRQCQQLIEVSPPEDLCSSNVHCWAELLDHKSACKSHGTSPLKLMKKQMRFKKRVVSCNGNNDAENEKPIDICNSSNNINRKMSQLSEQSPWLLGTNQPTLGLPDNFLPNEPAINSLCPDPEIIPWPVFSGIWHVWRTCNSTQTLNLKPASRF